MESFLGILFTINAVVLGIIILLQPPKSEDASGALTGAGVNVFAQSKERGLQLLLKRLTIVLGATFMIIPVLIAILASS